MPRNLVICCDGTNNKFGKENTNVVRLFQVLDRDSKKQHVYYDPGVGTMPLPGFLTRVGKRISEWWGLAFGAGIDDKVSKAYTFLMNFWERGDQVFLFGFSRGAYTVRILAGLLRELGLLPRGNEDMVPYAMELYKTAPRAHASLCRGDDTGYWKLRDDFRTTFSKAVHDGDHVRRFPVHFLGVWDTVSSVGWVWDPPKYVFTEHNPSVGVVRHAVSMDERRAFFRQNLMRKSVGQDLQQLWFPGVHCDVGGGYPATESGLWRLSFEWMVTEAEASGLHVDHGRLNSILGDPRPSPPPWNDPEHESLTWQWGLGEFFPKLAWNPVTKSRWPRLNLGQHRFLNAGDLLHRATLERIRGGKYSPRNLSRGFLDRVRALPAVPESMVYTP